MTNRRALRLLMIVLAVAGLGLTGCGKKGDLSPPPSHADPTEEDSTALNPVSGESARA